MRIALCTEILYPLYGVEKRVYEMARRLPEHGFEVDVFTSTPQRTFDDINIIQISNPTIERPPKRNYAFCVVYWASILKKLSRNGYDVIDANGHMTLFPCSIAGSISKKPVVATIHDLYLSEWSSMYSGKASSFMRLAEYFSSKMPFEKIITLNTSLKKVMVEKLCIDERKVEIIPSGIDVKYLNSIKSRKKENRIVYLGRLAPQKNVSMLLRAFSLVDSSFTLDIIGEGEEMEKLKKLASQLGISKRVVFHGMIKEHEKIVRMIKESSLFVLPSLRESFGITVLEAMCCGTAVVSTDTEGPRDRIVDGVNGFLCGFDESIMADKINAVVNNDRLRKRMEKNGMKTAADYDWDIIVKKISKEYEKIF